MNGARPNLTPSSKSPAVLHQGQPARPPVQPEPAEDLDTIELVDEPLEVDEAADVKGKKIITFGIDAGVHRQDKWTRQPVSTGKGACRMRSFHGKLSEQGMEYLDNAVNEWLDRHPEVEVKFVTSNVGMFDGKMKEPALILNLWY